MDMNLLCIGTVHAELKEELLSNSPSALVAVVRAMHCSVSMQFPCFIACSPTLFSQC